MARFRCRGCSHVGTCCLRTAICPRTLLFCVLIATGSIFKGNANAASHASAAACSHLPQVPGCSFCTKSLCFEHIKEPIGSCDEVSATCVDYDTYWRLTVILLIIFLLFSLLIIGCLRDVPVVSARRLSTPPDPSHYIATCLGARRLAKKCTRVRMSTMSTIYPTNLSGRYDTATDSAAKPQVRRIFKLS